MYISPSPPPTWGGGTRQSGKASEGWRSYRFLRVLSLAPTISTCWRGFIEVLSPFPKAETGERVAAGLVEAGYAIDHVDGTTIIPAVRMVRNVAEVHLRVNLLGSGDSTRVVLSATYDISHFQLKNEPTEANRSGMKKLVWQEVETAAAAVEQGLTSGAPAKNQ